jgi:hypothetical protein
MGLRVFPLLPILFTNHFRGMGIRLIRLYIYSAIVVGQAATWEC